MQKIVDREFRLSFWKLHILHHATQGPIYGLWMLQELAEHGHSLSPGTLYPILKRMEQNGWLISETSDGTKARRNFRISTKGEKLLRDLRRDVAELYQEVVVDAAPNKKPRRR